MTSMQPSLRGDVPQSMLESWHDAVISMSSKRCPFDSHVAGGRMHVRCRKNPSPCRDRSSSDLWHSCIGLQTPLLEPAVSRRCRSSTVPGRKCHIVCVTSGRPSKASLTQPPPLSLEREDGMVGDKRRNSRKE
jgi:hypothetical protein